MRTRFPMHIFFVFIALVFCLSIIGCGMPLEEEKAKSCSSPEDACEASGGHYYFMTKQPGQSYHYYKTVAGGSSLFLSVGHQVPNAEDSDYSLDVFKSDQSTLVESFGANDGIDEQRTLGVIPGETYYIRLNVGRASRETGYRLGLAYSDQPTEAEPNNDFTTAFPIEPGIEYRGGKNAGEGQDIFAIKAVSNQETVRATVHLKHEISNDRDSNFHLTIIRSNQTEIDALYANAGLDNEITFGMVANETYFIKVYVGGAPARRRYILRVDYDDEITEIEPNNDFTHATPMLPGYASSGYQGRKNGDDTYDYYTFIPGGNSMTVSLKHMIRNAPDSDFNVSIIDYGQRAVDSFSANDGLDGSVTLGVVPGSVYYIRVYVGRAPSRFGYVLALSSD